VTQCRKQENMETSILIAKIIGLIYVAFGVGLLLNKSYYIKAINSLLEDSSYFIIGGLLAIIIGILIIEYHNIWSNDWTIIITIIGWIALFKGITLLAFPKSFTLFKPLFNSDLFYKILAPFVIILGLIFIYFGFCS